LKILAVAALLVVWLVPVEAQGAHIDGAGFVERCDGEVYLPQIKDLTTIALLPQNLKRVSIALPPK
jgi:hypothetical protein